MGDDLDILRAKLGRIVAAGLVVAAAGRATARALAAARDSGPPPEPAAGGRRFILSLGRFARDMAVEALAALGPAETLIVAAEGAAPLAGARVLTAGWPEPDVAGARAASAVEAALGRLGRGDEALVLLSAGAERMVPAPADGIALPDFVAVERMMRAAGAGAGEAMLVRQQLSRFEGGGLLAFMPAVAVSALAVCDAAAGEDARHIAGGMLAAPLGSRVTARALLELYGLWARVPDRVRHHLAKPAPLLPPAPRPRLRIIASNAQSVAAMAGAGARAVARPLCGGPAEIVHDILAVAAGVPPGGAAVMGMEAAAEHRAGRGAAAGAEGGADGGDAAAQDSAGNVLALGAPVVAGRAGPRHADLALRFLVLARDRRLAGPWALLLTASDGGGVADGPAPGMAVDSETFVRLRAEGIDAEAALERGRAAEVLERIGAAFRSGPTGTDVGDLVVFVRG